jgi:hypothetical protein
MKPFAIVIHFELFHHLLLGVGSGIKAIAMHRFGLECHRDVDKNCISVLIQGIFFYTLALFT